MLCHQPLRRRAARPQLKRGPLGGLHKTYRRKGSHLRWHPTATRSETVLLRLRTSAGRPNVKLAATEDGAGLVLGGDADRTYAQILARGDSTSLKLSNKNGQVHLVKP